MYIILVLHPLLRVSKWKKSTLDCCFNLSKKEDWRPEWSWLCHFYQRNLLAKFLVATTCNNKFRSWVREAWYTLIYGYQISGSCPVFLRITFRSSMRTLMFSVFMYAERESVSVWKDLAEWMSVDFICRFRTFRYFNCAGIPKWCLLCRSGFSRIKLRADRRARDKHHVLLPRMQTYTTRSMEYVFQWQTCFSNWTRKKA